MIEIETSREISSELYKRSSCRSKNPLPGNGESHLILANLPILNYANRKLTMQDWPIAAKTTTLLNLGCNRFWKEWRQHNILQWDENFSVHWGHVWIFIDLWLASPMLMWKMQFEINIYCSEQCIYQSHMEGRRIRNFRALPQVTEHLGLHLLHDRQWGGHCVLIVHRRMCIQCVSPPLDPTRTTAFRAHEVWISWHFWWILSQPGRHTKNTAKLEKISHFKVQSIISSQTERKAPPE